MSLDEGAASAAHDTDTTALNPMESDRKIQNVPLGMLKLSPTDPRTGEDPVDVSDLDIGEVDEEGRIIDVLTPLLIRTRDSDGAAPLYFEIIDGGRRYRKALSKGFRLVPCEVRDDLTDAKIRTIQIVQNGQRRDLTPLQQAHAFAGMRDELGWSPNKIAARLHLDVRLVLQRLALLTLGEKAMAALKLGPDKLGGIGAAVALELSTVVNPDDQEEALEICIEGWDGVPLNANRARREIVSRYHLRLAEAPFDREADLKTGALPCGRCPKNSALQKDLFTFDGDEKAVCQDRSCWAAKRAAWTKRLEAEATERGAKIIRGPEAKKLYPHDNWYQGPKDLVPLETKVPGDEAKRTFRQVLGDVFKPSMLVVGDKDVTHELAKIPELKKALVAAGQPEIAKLLDPPAPAQVRPPAKLSPSQEAKQIEAKAERRGEDLFFAAIVGQAEKVKPDVKFWRFLVALVLTGMRWDEGIITIGLRRNIGGDPAKGLLKLSEKLSEPQLRGLFIEVLAASDLDDEEDSKLAAWGKAGRFFGVDLEKLRKAEVDTAKTEAAAKKAADAKAGKGKAAAKSVPAKAEPAKAEPAKAPAKGKAVPAPTPALEPLGPLDDEDDGDPEDDEEEDDLDDEDDGDPEDDDSDEDEPAMVEDTALVDDAPPTHDEAKASEPINTGSSCKVCGCTDLTPCVDDDTEEACSWNDNTHTLCSSCAIVMQSIGEQLGDEGIVANAGDLFALVEANGERGVPKALGDKVLAHCIAAGDVVELDSCLVSGRLVKGVLALCTTPRTTPQVRAAFKAIPPAALVEALEVMAAAGQLAKDGSKWITGAPGNADPLTGEEQVLLATAKPLNAKGIAQATGIDLVHVNDIVGRLFGAGKLSLGKGLYTSIDKCRPTAARVKAAAKGGVS
jgi:ParB/RepB/Spo0J family partition protein